MSALATIGDPAPSNRQQRRAPYRETLCGEDRYSVELSLYELTVRHREHVLDGSVEIDRLDREIAAQRHALARLSDQTDEAIGRAIAESRPECSDVDRLLDSAEQTSIEIEMSLQRRSDLERISRAAEATGASTSDLVRERDAAAAELARIRGLIRLWDRRVAQGHRAVGTASVVVLAGGRDLPVDVHALTIDPVEPDEPPGSLVAASPAAPHGPPARGLGAAA